MDWFVYDNGLRHERVKSKNELVLQLWILCLRGEMNLMTSVNFQDYLTEKKELCIMVVRHLFIGLHNCGLFYQKAL